MMNLIILKIIYLKHIFLIKWTKKGVGEGQEFKILPVGFSLTAVAKNF